MPAAIVDPATGAVGTPGAPASPLGNAFSNIVGVAGQQFPNPMERAAIAYHNAETQKTLQQIGAANTLQGIFQSALNPQPVTSTAEGPRPAPDQFGSDGPQPAVTTTTTPSPQDVLTKAMPALVGAMQAGGHIENTPQLARMMAAYVPGEANAVANTPVGRPSPMDLAMLGSGESYESTPGGFREKNQAGFTAEAKNRQNKINDIMTSQQVDYPTAEGLVDGISELTTDQAGNRVLTNKATGQSKLLYSMASGATNDARPGVGTPAPAAVPSGIPGAAPGAMPGVNPQMPAAAGAPGDKPINNPGNLRPVGSTTGFMQYPDMQSGMNALKNDLTVKLSGNSQAMGGQPPTLRNLLSVYSPATENNTPQLINNAAQRSGLNPDAPLNVSHLPLVMNAILAQEGNGGSAVAAGGQPAAGPSPQPGAPAAAAQFSMKPGDLGVPFEQMYGGPAVAGRAMHTASSFMGSNDPDPALAALGKLNALKQGLVTAGTIMPGRGANEGMQKRLLEQYPETDSNLLSEEGQNAVEQAGVNPVDAEAKFNQGIEQAVALRQQAHQALQNPYIDAKTRDAYMTVVNTVDKTLLQALPPQKYAEYQAYVNGAPSVSAAPMSNLDKGNALTAPSHNPASPQDAAKLPVGATFQQTGKSGVLKTWKVVSPGVYSEVK